MTRKEVLQIPNFIDVFAGCGGLSLGLKRAGWKGLFAIEKDEHAFETLSTNFPDSSSLRYYWPKYISRKAWSITSFLEEHGSDLRALRGSVDLLAGGPPCQGFSHAGRRNPADPRNRLFEDYLRLVDIVRPRMVLIENVRGFTTNFKNTQNGGIENFAKVLQERLAESYHLTAEVIRASDFGVPQARPRFILVGIRKADRTDVEIASFFGVLRKQVTSFLKHRDLPRRPTSKDAIGDLELSRCGTEPSTDSPGFLQIAASEPRTSYQRAMRLGHVGAISDLRLARHKQHIEARFADIIRSCNEDGRLNTTIGPELRERYALKKMAIRVLDPLRPAPTITSLPDDLLHYSEPRTLTVRENARLQTFPDWFAFRGKYTSGGNRRRHEVPRFTQVANAVPPLLAEQLGLVLKSVLYSRI